MSDLYYDGKSMEFVNKIDKRRNQKDWCVVLPNPFDNNMYCESYVDPITNNKLRIPYTYDEFHESYVHDHIRASKALYYGFDISNSILQYIYIPYKEYDQLTEVVRNE